MSQTCSDQSGSSHSLCPWWFRSNHVTHFYPMSHKRKCVEHWENFYLINKKKKRLLIYHFCLSTSACYLVYITSWIFCFLTDPNLVVVAMATHITTKGNITSPLRLAEGRDEDNDPQVTEPILEPPSLEFQLSEMINSYIIQATLPVPCCL